MYSYHLCSVVPSALLINLTLVCRLVPSGTKYSVLNVKTNRHGSSRLVKVAIFVPCEVEAQKATGCPELIVEPPVRAVRSALLPNVPLIT